jgi:primary-amine oxidase
MSTTFEASLPTRAAKQLIAHPLAPIDATEIKQAVSFVRSQWPADTDLHFKCITLQEPAKKEVVPYLEAEVSGGALPQIDRRVLVTYYIRRTVSHYLDLRTNSPLTYSLEQIPRGCRQLDHQDTRV